MPPRRTPAGRVRSRPPVPLAKDLVRRAPAEPLVLPQHGKLTPPDTCRPQLGHRQLLWGFGLPSGCTCSGRSCHRNLAFRHWPDFAPRVPLGARTFSLNYWEKRGMIS
jgi:hypothetical protein